MSIVPLPQDVQAGIKSSVEITSLTHVVEELFKNALDADAHNVTIDLDFAKGYCSVKDDGFGIPSAEFLPSGRLAQLHCTSKQGSESYGRHGRFLFYLSAMSLLFISSHHTLETQTATIIIRHRDIVSREVGLIAEELQNHGTKVVVNNLFGSLPVRFKYQAAQFLDPLEVQKQFDVTVRRLTSYLLASNAQVNLRLSVVGERLKYIRTANKSADASQFSSERIIHIFQQAGFSSPSQIWKLASAKANEVSIRAAVNLTPFPSKQNQFVSFGRHPVQAIGTGAGIYKTINALFESSVFGAVEDTPGNQAERRAMGNNPDYKQPFQHSKLMKGVDRWPSFYVRIDTSSAQLFDSVSEFFDPQSTSTDLLQRTMSLLQMLFGQFLQANHLHPKRVRPGRRKLQGKEASEHRSLSNGSAERKSTKDEPVIPQEAPRHRFSSSEPPERRRESLHDEDVRLLLQDIELRPDLDVDEVQSSANERSTGTPAAHDGSLTWTNPWTKNVSQLDPSTGCIKRSRPMQQPNEPSTSEMEPVAASRIRQGPSGICLTSEQLAFHLQKWPFKTVATDLEVSIPSISSVEPQHHLGFTDSWQHVDAKALTTAKVLCQIDNKFILAMLATATCQIHSSLVLIDQHAADERIKVEAFYQELCAGKRVILERPMMFEVSDEEAKHLEQTKAFFSSWAVDYQVLHGDSLEASSEGHSTVAVTHLPSVVAERCRLEPRIIIDLLRREIWSENSSRKLSSTQRDEGSYIARMACCPTSLRDMINSRACRSAIMFNDVLTNDQCEGLLQKLSWCILPFQCAHGRPSVIALTTFGEQCEFGSTEQNQETIGSAFRRWNS